MGSFPGILCIFKEQMVRSHALLKHCSNKRYAKNSITCYIILFEIEPLERDPICIHYIILSISVVDLSANQDVYKIITCTFSGIAWI